MGRKTTKYLIIFKSFNPAARSCKRRRVRFSLNVLRVCLRCSFVFICEHKLVPFTLARHTETKFLPRVPLNMLIKWNASIPALVIRRNSGKTKTKFEINSGIVFCSSLLGFSLDTIHVSWWVKMKLDGLNFVNWNKFFHKNSVASCAPVHLFKQSWTEYFRD